MVKGIDTLKMTPKERVLKFDRSDADSENTYILLNAKSKGSKPLDLKLEAIDFESCFVHTREFICRFLSAERL